MWTRVNALWRPSPIGLLACLGLALSALTGCGSTQIKPDSASGKDFERAGAQQLFFDKLKDDFLSASEGDNTDWLFFKVQEKGFLKLTIFWDDHKDVQSIIDIRDRFGALLDSRRHSAEVEKDQIDLRVEAGTHFIRLNTKKGDSVYTIEGIFTPFDFEPTDDDRPVAAAGGDILDEGIPDDIRPDPVSGGGARRGGGRTSRRGGSGGGARRPKRGSGTGGGGGGGSAISGKTVGASIVRVLSGPRKKGAFLTLNRGSKHGVIRGAKGCILKASGACFATIIIKEVGASATKAYTTSRPNEIADRRRVKIQIQ
ncbi:MAG: hypothetical protein ACI9U2_000025 [Bradymonadia bacterium]|jgi:hypothetical protein